jgi:periplasmic protein TonB
LSSAEDMDLLTSLPPASSTESQPEETRAAPEEPRKIESLPARRAAEPQLWQTPATPDQPSKLETPAVTGTAEPKLWGIPTATEALRKVEEPAVASTSLPQLAESSVAPEQSTKVETPAAANAAEPQLEETPAAPREPKKVEAPVEESVTQPQLEEIPAELEEPSEIEAPPAIPIPLVKPNMISREVMVRAIGVPPEKNELERALFNEETVSLLVCETGGVIRLSAAVTPGQLLILRNVEAKREVVVQVLRKRAYKPTICYVELEFAEAAPRFWGMDFSAATALLPRGAQDSEVASQVIAAEATADETGFLPAAASAEELRAFKREVEQLSGKPLAMETPAASQEASAVAQLSADVSSAFPALPAGQVLSTEAILKSGLDAAGVPLRAKSLPIERDPVPAQWTATEQEVLPKPSLDFSKSLPKSKRLRRARGSFTPGFRGGALRLALLVAALGVTIVGAAWFKHWIPWMPGPKSASAGKPTIGASAKSGRQAGNQEPANEHPEFNNTKVASDAPVTTPGMPAKNPVPRSAAAPAPGESVETGAQPPTSSSSATQPAVKKSAASLVPTGKTSAALAATRNGSESGALATGDSEVVPPKLIKSVRAVASLEALRDFETGNVVIDAVVGTGGEVNFISVISGPPSLRDSAVQSLKQYQYEPATRNGQPVPAHVTITIHFRFEP